MNIKRPLWARGVLVSPQHFQQQAALAAWHDECVAQMGVMHPWGVLNVEFDRDALTLGRLKANHLTVRFSDGTLIDTDRVDRLPPTLTLSEAGNRDITVMLALPQWYPNGGNCLALDDISERPVRYRQHWRDVRDCYSDDTRQMATLQPELTLRLDSQDNSDYLVCPVVRVHRDMQGGWALDDAFIPPLLSLQANSWLSGQLELLMTQLLTRLDRLMAMRRESNERMADFAIADVSLFWLLNALNSAEPVLRYFQRHPQVHPERLYQELARLAGGLLTFSLTHTVRNVPVYSHEQLTAVFPPLFALLSDLLEASLPTRVVAIELTHEKPLRQWLAHLHDSRLREEVDFYLCVRSSLPAAQLLEQFVQQCKVGSPDDVDCVINASGQGIPLKALSHVPAAIPLRLENQYFALDMTHPAAQAMRAAGRCVFYVPGTLGELELELFAVLRT